MDYVAMVISTSVDAWLGEGLFALRSSVLSQGEQLIFPHHLTTESLLVPAGLLG